MQRYESLDSMRGICACGVVLFHFAASGFLCGLPPVRGGELFVDFFFVLSGFVISASYGDRLRGGFSVTRFMALRLGRVYPMHVLMLALFVGIELIAVAVPSLSPRQAFTGNHSLAGLFNTIFLLQGTMLAEGTSWNTPSWSIVVEIWTYLITAIVLRYAGAWFWAVIGAMIALTATQLVVSPEHLLNGQGTSVQRCIYGFCIGMVGFALYRRYRDRARALLSLPYAANIGEICLVSLALWLISIAGKGVLTMLAPPLFMVVVFIFAQEQGVVSRLLLARPMRLLGTLSYSIYMVHMLIYSRLLDVLRMVGPHVGLDIVRPDGNGGKVIRAAWYVADFWTVAMLAIVILAAWFTYRFVEVPAREWSRRVAANIGGRSAVIA